MWAVKIDTRNKHALRSLDQTDARSSEGEVNDREGVSHYLFCRWLWLLSLILYLRLSLWLQFGLPRLVIRTFTVFLGRHVCITWENWLTARVCHIICLICDSTRWSYILRLSLLTSFQATILKAIHLQLALADMCDVEFHF